MNTIVYPHQNQLEFHKLGRIVRSANMLLVVFRNLATAVSDASGRDDIVVFNKKLSYYDAIYDYADKVFTMLFENLAEYIEREVDCIEGTRYIVRTTLGNYLLALVYPDDKLPYIVAVPDTEIRGEECIDLT